jgi:hypothetical protein
MPKGQYERKPKEENMGENIEQAPEQPNWEQFQALQRELQQATSQIAKLANQNAELARESKSFAPQILPDHEQPVYETTQPYMSPDDVYYPEGVQFVDVTGQIIPNETMIPLNEAAQRRMNAYLATLPAPGGTPSLEDMIDAVMQVSRQVGDNPQDRALMAGAVMQRAIELKYSRLGVSQDPMRRPVFTPATRVADQANIPLMSNTNFRAGAHVPERPGAVSRTKTSTRVALPSDHAPAMAGVRVG